MYAVDDPPCSCLLDLYGLMARLEDCVTAVRNRPMDPFKKDDDLVGAWRSSFMPLAPPLGTRKLTSPTGGQLPRMPVADTRPFIPSHAHASHVGDLARRNTSDDPLSPHVPLCKVASAPVGQVPQQPEARQHSTQQPPSATPSHANYFPTRQPHHYQHHPQQHTQPHPPPQVSYAAAPLPNPSPHAPHSPQPASLASLQPAVYPVYGQPLYTPPPHDQQPPRDVPTDQTCERCRRSAPAHDHTPAPAQHNAERLPPPDGTPPEPPPPVPLRQSPHAEPPPDPYPPAAPIPAYLSSPPARRAPSAILEIPLADVHLQQVIGEGGFGKVYRAAWRGATVAVKVMSSDTSARGDVVAEFRREVHTMSCIPPHPHVLQLLGACTRGPHLALVAEFCARGSLYSMLHSPHVHLSWRQIVYLCLGVARGMAHLHAHKVLHRDLKSGNLLVDENLCVKVADFGLSKVIQDFQTLTGGLGTYQWMAPEVLGNSRYSEKADVYSFGIVLWECSARQVPYAGTLGMPAAIAVMNRGLRPSIPAYTPPALAALMRRCWAALPGERPPFAAVADDLAALYDDMPRP